MITFKRVDYAFAELDATPEEWAAVQRVLRHAVEHYSDWELDYVISGPAVGRFGRLQSMAERLLLPDPLPCTIHIEDIQILFCVGTIMDRAIIPGLSAADCEILGDQLTRYPVRSLFPDYLL